MSAQQETSAAEWTGLRPLDEVSRRALDLYETRLRRELEPQYLGQMLAIHVASGDYGVGRSSGEAVRAVRAMQPDGPLVLLRIGLPAEPGLAARLLGTRPESSRSG